MNAGGPCISQGGTQVGKFTRGGSKLLIGQEREGEKEGRSWTDGFTEMRKPDQTRMGGED